MKRKGILGVHAEEVCQSYQKISMNYYFVVGLDQSQHTGMTSGKILNYIYNTSRIMFGDSSLLMGMQTINLENDTQYIVYHPRYTKIVQTPVHVSVIRLDGKEVDDGTV